jgi:hypothetical protein
MKTVLIVLVVVLVIVLGPANLNDKHQASTQKSEGQPGDSRICIPSSVSLSSPGVAI